MSEPHDHEPLERDRPETPFSVILSSLVREHPGVRAAVFLDVEGECIDYASREPPFEAMVFAATLLNPTREMVARAPEGAGDRPIQWWVEADAMSAVVRRVSDEHVLVVWLEASAISVQLLRAVVGVAERLRSESGLDAPTWDPVGQPVEVELREAKGWGYAPKALKGAHAASLEVLGRWTESQGITAQLTVCFRVRLAESEWTLVHEPSSGRWFRR